LSLFSFDIVAGGLLATESMVVVVVKVEVEVEVEAIDVKIVDVGVDVDDDDDDDDELSGRTEGGTRALCARLER
jgi:hypothetical protein